MATSDARTFADQDLASRHRKVMAGGSTRSTLFIPPSAPYLVSGSGSCVVDTQGHETLDLSNNYTALIHGHAFAPVVQAATTQIHLGSAFGLPTESEIVLAETLALRSGLPKWRFSNSGTEAVMTALRGARAFTGRDLVVRFAASYHGMHENVIDSQAPGVPASFSAAVLELPQGDRAAVAEVFARHGSHIAAVLIDLLPNRVGLIPADMDFVHFLREITRSHGALLVVDEVISYRLAVGGMFTQYDISPDLVTVGKIIGGGFPVGAVGGTEDVMAVFDPSRQNSVFLGGTFSANPVTMVAGQVALAHFEADEVNRLNALGNNFRAQLTEAGVGVHGCGSLARLSFDGDRQGLWWSLYRAGVLVGTSTLMALSTPMTQAQVDQAAEIIIRCVRELS